MTKHAIEDKRHDSVQTDQPVQVEVSPRAPNTLDRQIGTRIREARLHRGLSQQELGEATDISYQQIQKYERGKNRIAASRLSQFANVLDVPPSYFFTDPDALVGSPILTDAGLTSPDTALDGEDLESACALARLTPDAKRSVNDLIRVLSQSARSDT